MKIHYITSNTTKFKEAQLILNDWNLIKDDLDVVEIQGTPEEVAIAKAKKAYELLQQPLIVEDVSLFCPAINNLPSTYIKEFLIKLGEEGFYQLIKNYEDHSVLVTCTVAYIDDKTTPTLFTGKLTGTVVAPKGGSKHGKYSFNSFVKPTGFDQTLGEMDLQKQSSLSMRRDALIQLKEYFNNL